MDRPTQKFNFATNFLQIVAPNFLFLDENPRLLRCHCFHAISQVLTNVTTNYNNNHFSHQFTLSPEQI